MTFHSSPGRGILDDLEHTLQSLLVRAASATDLRPTLLRTCRVLANHTRLRVFRFLLQQPEQTVSEVASHLNLPQSVASQYLRTLESRSLLKARRVGRWVKYQISPANRV